MTQITDIKSRVRGLIVSEDGAVTIDWVVLTASLVMLGMAAAFLVTGNVPGLADKISTYISTMSVNG
ncbi:hypothetical protein [Aliiroseovarius sediminis]|uniref:hypothetical protein n=1 Tax=Aliiroseovarius sediminis TaxID=2925839 RepID=UPI001F57E9E9|nr:hypothetical protein [Aliiroseovarius sediminis]MCI2394989.1 hypothetical protein [Aliiroseovarius sediminis]